MIKKRQFIILLALIFTQMSFSQRGAYFITKWSVDITDTYITIPTTGTGYDYAVRWGDGTYSSGVTGNITHHYSTPGTYTVEIKGDFPRIYFNNTGDKEKIQSVIQWGSYVWTSMENAFFGCSNLNGTAIDNPDLTHVSNMSSMYAGARIFNGDISGWDVSNVINMHSLFDQAEAFNQDVSHWNVSHVKDMSYMFSNAQVFNQDIGNWNVENVNNMDGMFGKAYAFNQNIGGWNVSMVKSMRDMFYYANSFNQNLEEWEVVSLENASNMFKGIALSTPNYDALLIGWSALSLKHNVDFHGGNSQYCMAEAERQYIIDTFDWSITDGGSGCFCTAETAWNGVSWDPIEPNYNVSVTIEAPYDTSVHGSFSACSLGIKPGQKVNIAENDYILVANDIYNHGGIYIRDTGSLVQVAEDATISGPGQYRIYRKTTPYVEYDYTYWSSPTNSDIIKEVFYYNSELISGTGDPFSNPNYIFWLDTTSFNDDDGDSYDDEGDDWQQPSSTEVMIPGKGYIALGAGSDIPFDPTDFEIGFQQQVHFEGEFNTGHIERTLQLDNSTTDDFTNQNLIGNPYPSAIDMNKLMAANIGTLEGTFYFWTHDTPVSSGIPGPDTYNFTNDDYAVATSDGVVYSGTAAASETLPTQFIASSQGFLVNTLLDAGVDYVRFENNMRVTGPNDEFRSPRTSEPYLDRIWLNLFNEEGLFRQLLVNFYAAATIDFDSGLDGQRLNNGTNPDFYSIIESDTRRFAIQTQDKFDESKQIRLGFEIVDAGYYKLKIDHFKGIFEDGQKVFLEDRDLDLIHELTESEYHFYSVETSGNEKRFVLRFMDVSKSIDNKQSLTTLNLYPNPTKDFITLQSDKTIQSWELSNQYLRILLNSSNEIKSDKITIDLGNLSTGVYYLKTIFTDGNSVTKTILKE